MNLLASGRAMDDFHLRQRILAAVAREARGYLNAAAGNAKNYAVSTLLAPQSLDPSMLALVVTDDAVSAGITVSTDGETVDTATVPDGDIIAAVQANWPLVAAKYPNNPLSK